MFPRFTMIVTLASLMLAACATSSHAATLSELCATFGESAEQKIALRDQGVLPSQLLKLVEDINAKKKWGTASPWLSFQRWMIIFVYDMSAMDATWIRQRVETKCLHDFR